MSTGKLQISVFALALVLAAAPLPAAVILVDPAVTVASDGLCSLPEAVANANTDSQAHPDCPAGSSGDDLVLAAGHQYEFASAWSGGDNALPPITTNMVIAGNGATVLRDEAAGAFRLFRIDASSVTIQNLTISNGLSDFPMVGGGAIHVSNAELTLQNVAFLSNSATGDLLALGGGLRTDDSTVAILDSVFQDNTAFSTDPEVGGGAIAQRNGELTIRRSALLDNRADMACAPGSPDDIASTGGALRVEADAVSGARTFIFDSTLAGNLGRVGGAIHVVAIADTGIAGIEDVFVELKRSTVVFNDATGCGTLPGLGDGIHVQRANSGRGLVFFGNNILHGNGLAINDDIIGVDCSANSPSVSFFSGEGNVLDPDDQCPTTGFDAFEADIDAIIDAARIVDHYLPLAGGPAVDLPEAGVNCVAFEPDQLGNFRAAGPDNGGDLCDAGAVELQETPTLFPLEVTVTGDGAGSVSSSPAGIDCPETCSADFPENEKVVLEVQTEAGSDFAGWSGDCSGLSVCVVSMDQARAVSAAFNGPSSFELEVALASAPGSGTVTSTPAGIDCPGTCTADFPVDAEVELEALPGPGFEFTGWGVACAGNPNPCTVSMDQDRLVSAVFDPVPTFELTVVPDGSGSGTVTSIPDGIDCPGICTADFDENEKVVLEAAASPRSSFVRWGGACSGNGTCVVSMDQARNVTATFEQAGFNLDVILDGAGSGRVFGGPIDCPGTCSAMVEDGTEVALAVSVDPGSVFQGFSGDCNGGTCNVVMDADRSVRAVFLSQDQLFLDSFE